MPAPRVPRILVVDDEPAIQRLVARALEEEGYEVAVVSDGQEAFDAVTRADPVYDLVVTNNRMPHMDGAELITRLRADFPGLPIVHLDDRSQEYRMQLPADVPTLYKPFDVDRLLDAVRRYVRR